MHTKHTTHSRGFTTIELIITITIFALISGTVLFRSAQFDSTILFTNQVYEAALEIREAQVFGISARESLDTMGDFQKPFGVYFTDSDMTSFVLFNDTYEPLDYVYVASQDDLLDAFLLSEGAVISDFCAIMDSGGEDCQTSSGGNAIDELNIVFNRPNPSPIIETSPPNVSPPPDNYVAARIEFESPRGNSLSIVIESTGQISVQ